MFKTIVVLLLAAIVLLLAYPNLREVLPHLPQISPDDWRLGLENVARVTVLVLVVALLAFFGVRLFWIVDEMIENIVARITELFIWVSRRKNDRDYGARALPTDRHRPQ